MVFKPTIVKKGSPEIKRASCEIHGVLTYTVILGLTPMLTKTGKVDDRCKKVHACPMCFRDGVITEVGR